MPLRPGETQAAFKARVIDPISPSFCGAKWLNSTLWLNQGQTASCHHPPMHPMDPEEVVRDPSAIHNTAHKRKMRKLMLDGQRPEECDYCWRIEDLGTGNLSDRTFKTLDFSEAVLNGIAATGSLDAVPESLEIAFDRTCQFACTYCSATFSTAWVRDIRRNGPYQNILNDDRQHHATDAPWAQPLPPEDNPYIAAFWRWWPELSRSLKEIRITGGEPLMSTDVWKLFDWFAANPGSSMRFSINSNLGAKGEIIDRLVSAAGSVRDFCIYTSNEAHGAQAEYIRDGLDYAQWTQNIERILTETKARVGVMTTVNGICLSTFPRFLDHVLDLKRRYEPHRMMVSVNVLRHPNYMALRVLPRERLGSYASKIINWVDVNNASSLLTDFEREHLSRFVGVLRDVLASDLDPDERARLEHDFRAFHSQYDARRGKSFEATFPDLADWYRNIP